MAVTQVSLAQVEPAGRWRRNFIGFYFRITGGGGGGKGGAGILFTAGGGGGGAGLFFDCEKAVNDSRRTNDK